MLAWGATAAALRKKWSEEEEKASKVAAAAPAPAAAGAAGKAEDLARARPYESPADSDSKAVMELEFTDADDRTVQLKREGSEVVLYLDGDFGFAGVMPFDINQESRTYKVGNYTDSGGCEGKFKPEEDLVAIAHQR